MHVCPLSAKSGRHLLNPLGKKLLSLAELTKATTRRVEDDEVGEDIERIGLAVAVVNSPGCVGERCRACSDRVPEGTRQGRRERHEGRLVEGIKASGCVSGCCAASPLFRRSNHSTANSKAETATAADITGTGFQYRRSFRATCRPTPALRRNRGRLPFGDRHDQKFAGKNDITRIPRMEKYVETRSAAGASAILPLAVLGGSRNIA